MLLSQADPKWKDQSSPIALNESKAKKLSIVERLQAFSSPETKPVKKELKKTFSDPETTSDKQQWTSWEETKGCRKSRLGRRGEIEEKLYYNPKEPASFGGVKRLSDASGLKKTRVRKFLSGEDPYTLHFPVRYKFQRRKTIAYGVNELWQSDLVDLQKISRFNRGYRYLLTIIDAMSRYLRAFLSLRSKTKKLVRSLKFSTKFLKRFQFAVNDVVRISKARKVFRKGYLPGWTEETFIIYKRYPTYVLQDLSGKEIAGRFYTEELQKIDKSDNDLWAIEKIIRKKVEEHPDNYL
ncbi:chromo domain-containing protein [Trichonephila clavipes]|nr:chromo domain-containing protein [Trichonephila clavipes]